MEEINNQNGSGNSNENQGSNENVNQNQEQAQSNNGTNQNQEQVVNIKFALSPFAIKEKRFDIKNNRNRQERIYRRRLYNIFQCICIWSGS